jgi:hypothetical protein
MSIKPVSHKIRWLAAGLFSGIFVTIFIPQIFLPDRLKNYENELLVKTSFQPMEYSHWPPFLTDSTLDLVNLFRLNLFSKILFLVFMAKTLLG